MRKILIVGAGPAGLMAGIAAASAGAAVTVLERNPFAGKKLRITGKGRCNVTNNCTAAEVMEAVPHNAKFLYGALNRFAPADTMAFFEAAGVPLKTERGRRVFPVSDHASDIQEALVREAGKAGVRFRYGTRVTGLEKKEDGGWLVRAGHAALEADAVILATGGYSYPATGSSGDGHELLAGHGIRITEIKPSLVPIETEEDFAPLSGLTLKNVRLTVYAGEKQVWAEQGEMLFTHFGVSGPLVLSASSNMQDLPVTDYRLAVNLKPALSAEELDRRLISDFAKYSARDFINALGDLLPQKLIPVTVAVAGIDPRKKTGEISKEERNRFAAALTAFPVTPSGFRPIDEAIITSGGVDTKELNPKTMELKKLPGLYCAGELIDIDAYTGGYNLQLAFATGKAAGEAAAAEY